MTRFEFPPLLMHKRWHSLLEDTMIEISQRPINDTEKQILLDQVPGKGKRIENDNYSFFNLHLTERYLIRNLLAQTLNLAV